MTSVDFKKQQLSELLKIHFGYNSWRPGQAEAIDNILHGRNTIVVLPTGGGKSLIYQLPALVLEGVTIVISPLIALMKDQVDSLDKVGIPATFINSSLSLKESEERLGKIRKGLFKIIYIAPERFYNYDFVNELKKIKVALFAIDEAHCISQWGHDFRPSYIKLKEAIKLVGHPVVVALTATATPEVRDDI
ncbi:MAG: DEAD/DEAH box helicase, partial [Candidatus Falkowbacteria bacterium]|nr:DEAD/DEAH box helicase [Candidatus Falkowbacteria bacterium]